MCMALKVQYFLSLGFCPLPIQRRLLHDNVNSVPGNNVTVWRRSSFVSFTALY
jgi:hypothetical protein